ncbi:kelch domain-containing protein 1 isoform X3 [Antennarius striatus]|uniref:kelch domain-containing protein 1 isoform X3 n=1 Tax=Antennarius striatus TaxID=241820 RepID=UPI0035AD8FA4
MDSGPEGPCCELVAQERSGHTAVVVENRLYVWGGYMSVGEEEVFLPNYEIWVYDLERGIWDVFNMTGELPPPMSGTCGCSLDGDMYIFGGCDYSGQTNQLTDIYWGWNNEVHTFDPMNASWRQPETHVRHLVFRAALPLPELPMPAAYLDVEATSAEVESWKPGGATFTAWTWNHGRGQKCMHVTERVPVSAGPEGRSWHTLTAVSDSSLFLFGGLRVDCKPMSDGWLLDVETKKWREVDHNFKNKPRLWHTACPCKDSDVIVFGGSCDYILRVDTGHCNDTLIFQMQPHPLFRICKDFIAKNVKKHEMLRSQLTLLPPSLLTAVQSRMYFYRPSNKQTN